MSLVAGKEKERAEAVELALSGGEEAAPSTPIFKPYKFRMEELDGFRYRALDAWRSVTRIAIREARLKEIKQEMLNSSKLQSHFADNPRDLNSLRHDKALHTVQHQVCFKLNKLFLKRLDTTRFFFSQAHLKHIPNYIVPQTLKKLNTGSAADRKNKAGFKKNTSQGKSAAKRKFQKQQGDALRGIAKR